MIGIVVGILSLGYAFYQTRHSQQYRVPKVCSQFVAHRVIRRTHSLVPRESVKILFNDTEIDSLSISQVILWNDSRGPVRPDNIAPLDRLRISFFPSSKVFGCEIIKRTNIANNVSAAVNDAQDGIELGFDYLSYQDGFVLKIIHDGEGASPVVHGQIIGQKGGVHSYGRFVALNRNAVDPSSARGIIIAVMMRSYKIFNRFDFLIIDFLIIVGVVIALAPWLTGGDGNFIATMDQNSQLLSKIVITGVGALYALLGLILRFTARRRFPASLLPDEYRYSPNEQHQNKPGRYHS